jgi:hypothetical protein
MALMGSIIQLLALMPDGQSDRGDQVTAMKVISDVFSCHMTTSIVFDAKRRLPNVLGKCD